MALKGVSIRGCATPPQLSVANFQSSNSRVPVNLRYDFDKCRKWESCCLSVLAQRAVILVDDEKPSAPGVESCGVSDHFQGSESKGFHKNVNLLPSKIYLSLISQYQKFAPFFLLYGVLACGDLFIFYFFHCYISIG